MAQSQYQSSTYNEANPYYLCKSTTCERDFYINPWKKTDTVYAVLIRQLSHKRHFFFPVIS